MIDTECYKELNLYAPEGGPSPDLIEDQPPTPPRRSFLDRVFKRRRVRDVINFIKTWLSILIFMLVPGGIKND